MTIFETSESTAKLDGALAEAQGHIEAALKLEVNEAFKRGGKASKYADLNAVWSAARPALAAAKIAVTQWPVHSDDNRLHMVTRLAHEGEWMRAHFSLPVTNQTAHGYGGAITYCRRFCFAAAIGVVTDEDDDGNAASGKDKDGNGAQWPQGNAAAKTYKPAPTATTPGAVAARHNNDMFSEFQREINNFRTKEEARKWKSMRWRDIDEHVSPDNMAHLDELYEKQVAALP